MGEKAEVEAKTELEGKTEIAAVGCIHCHICQKHCSFLEKYHIDIGDTDRLRELAYHCFLCGKCTAVCPKGIDGKGLVLAMRQEEVVKNQGKCREKGYTLLRMEKQDYIFRNKRHAKGKSILFLGCNFPSYYPETSKLLIRVLQQKAGMGVLIDCCGKPIAELGMTARAERVVQKLDETLQRAGAVEAVMVCPNCYDFLKNRLSVPVISIYEKLAKLELGNPVEGQIPLFLPCPDREKRQWVAWLSPFLTEKPQIIEGAQCCGLGGCAAVKEGELAGEMVRQVQERGYERVYAYCASCAGNLTKNGCPGVTHLLPEILGTGERPDTARSLLNRLTMKFW